MRTPWILLILALAAVASAQTAQAPPAFEVASIKLFTEGRSGAFPTPGMLYIGNRTLKGLIIDVYRLQGYQLTGGDRWMETIAYTIVGKAAGPAKFGEMMEMTKTLMADRFQLKFHWETRELPTYWLVPGKSGLKMKIPPDDDTRGWIRNRPRSLEGHKMAMAQLLYFLQDELQMPIEDKTGLAGAYDFKLEWSDDSQVTADAIELQKPSLFAAVQDQLGLKLELHRGPVQVLVIDSAQKPTEN